MNLEHRRCLKTPESSAEALAAACACGCGGSFCDECACAWLCTVGFVVFASSVGEAVEACARCSPRLLLGRSSMISSSPSFGKHQPPAELIQSQYCYVAIFVKFSFFSIKIFILS